MCVWKKRTETTKYAKEEGILAKTCEALKLITKVVFFFTDFNDIWLINRIKTFIWDLLPRGYWNAFWFGISDEKVEDDWYWVDGTKLVGG